MTSKTPPFLTITTKAGKLSWKDYEELSSWAQKLQADWGWIGGQTESGTHAWSNLGNLHNAVNQISNLRNYLNDANSTASVLEQQIKPVLISLLDSYPWLLVGSPFRAYVEELRKQNPRIAANIVALHMQFVSMSNWQEMPVNIEAVVEYKLYKQNITKATKPITSELEQLASSIRSKLTDFDEEQHDLVNRQTKRLSDIEEAESQRTEEFASAQKVRNEAWDADLNNTKNQLESIKQAYDDFMSLQAPARYWRAKQKKHFWLSIGYALFAVLFFIVGGLVLIHQIKNLYQADIAILIKQLLFCNFRCSN
jgi:hypothetical protein